MIVLLKKSILLPCLNLIKQVLVVYVTLFFVAKPVVKYAVSALSDKIELFEIENESSEDSDDDEETKLLFHGKSQTDLDHNDLSKSFIVLNSYNDFIGDILSPPPEFNIG